MNHPALSRRQLIAGAAAMAAGPAGDWTAQLTAPRGAVVWGSSSASSHRFDEPDALRDIRIHAELTSLGVPTIEHGYGAWHTPEILAIRSADHPLRLDLSAVDGVIPGEGEIHAAVISGNAPAIPADPLPGTVAGVEMTMSRADEETEADMAGDRELVRLHRLHPGHPVELESPSEASWTTALEDRFRGSIHVLWMGANNIEDPDQVLADTEAAFGVDPDSTLVMTHVKSWWNRNGTDKGARIDKVNDGCRETFGDHCLDVAETLWDRRWWQLPDLAPLDLEDDASARRRRGQVPRDLVADDGIHVNAGANLILAHALFERMGALGML